MEPDVAEANDTAAQPTPIEDLELVTRGRAPPAWRRDDFPAAGPVRRSVYAPPYSLRPPDTEPEVWLSLNQKSKYELSDKLKLRDPECFATQELRRKNYIEMKKKVKVRNCLGALLVLRCKMLVDEKN